MWFEWVCFGFVLLGIANMAMIARGWADFGSRRVNISYFIANLVVTGINFLSSWSLIQGWFNG